MEVLVSEIQDETQQLLSNTHKDLYSRLKAAESVKLENRASAMTLVSKELKRTLMSLYSIEDYYLKDQLSIL